MRLILQKVCLITYNSIQQVLQEVECLKSLHLFIQYFILKWHFYTPEFDIFLKFETNKKLITLCYIMLYL